MLFGVIRLNHLSQIPDGIRLPGTKHYSNSVLGSEPRSVIQGFLTFPHSMYNEREKLALHNRIRNMTRQEAPKTGIMSTKSPT